MIAWTIEAAIESKIFDRILVSTDSEKIARIAENYGIEVPFLRTDFMDDHAPVSMATIFALEQVKSKLQESYEMVVQLMPNCPLRNSLDINQAYQHFIHSKAPAQISSFKYGWMNPWWAAELSHSGVPAPLFSNKLTQRSQDLPPLYGPSGAIWLGQVEHILRAKTFYCPNHIFYPMNWKSAIDIDDFEDLELAKAAFILAQQEKNKVREQYEIETSN